MKLSIRRGLFRDPTSWPSGTEHHIESALEFIANCVNITFCTESSSWNFSVKIELANVNLMHPAVQCAFLALLEGKMAKYVLVVMEVNFESQPVLVDKMRSDIPPLHYLFNVMSDAQHNELLMTNKVTYTRIGRQLREPTAGYFVYIGQKQREY